MHQDDDVNGAHPIQPIAIVRSPYREKFGVPRQSGLVTAARGSLQMLPGFDMPDAFEGLDGFSHLWVIFGFDRNGARWSPRVRPPRLGGNATQGVFATRSPFRPNGLGLSVLRLEKVYREPNVRLAVAGLDLVDGTPVYDIKPYLPYADCPGETRGGFADQAPSAALSVRFSDRAETQLATVDPALALRELIVQTLSLDPRPAYRRNEPAGRVYGMQLMDWDVRWRLDGRQIEVTELSRAG